MKLKREKFAIITSGGGMKCSWIMGALIALAKKHRVISPDIFICASGSTGAGAYYITRQYDDIRKMWETEMPQRSWKEILKSKTYLDIDYIIDDFCKKQFPLNTKKFYNSKTLFFISAINRKSGEVTYFSNKDGTDIFESMRASIAIPLAYKPNPKAFINNIPYSDSLLTAHPKTHIKKAIELGADKILIIDTSSPLESRDILKYILDMWTFFQDRTYKENYKRNIEKTKKYIPNKNIKIFTLKPTNKLLVDTLTNNQQLINKTIVQGYEETLENKELKEFLKN